MSLIKSQNGSRFLWWSLLVVILDQLTKYLILNNVPLNTAGINVTPFFNIVHVYNTGAAFSFLAQSGGWQRFFFMAVAIVISLGLVIMLLRTDRSKKLVCFGVALVIGGAVGNLIDRMVWGHVVDFLLFYLRTDSNVYAYPAFNVADIAVCSGAALLVFASFKSDKKSKVRPS